MGLAGEGEKGAAIGCAVMGVGKYQRKELLF